MNHDAPHQSHDQAPQRPEHAGQGVITLAVPTGQLPCCECREAVEQRLAANPNVRSVHLDPEHQVAHVQVQDGTVTAAELGELIASVCGERNPVPLPSAEVSTHAYAHVASKSSKSSMDHAAMGHGAQGAHDMSDPNMAATMEADMRRRFLLSLLLGLPVVLYSPLATNIFNLHLPTPFGIPPDWIMLAFATPVALWTSSVFHIGAYYSLRSGALNMSVLVSLGILTSYLFSLGLTFFAPGQETFYEAAVMLAVFLLFGHWMEMKARRGSSDSVRKLLDLTPRQATIERHGQQVEVPVAEVKVGDVVLIKPGDRVPVDGVVLDGRSTIDESMVTGESIPVEKDAGDQVIAGTINQSGSLRFRATKVGADTALAQIVRLVETAQNSKAPAQRLADRAAHYLVLVAVGSGLLTFLIWFFWLREPLLMALTFAVTAVVIACPDALGLATPTAVMVATDLAARRGILFKQAVALEQAARIQAIIFDKTGTLTEGKPRVTDVVPSADLTETELLQLAGAAETRSGHPLAQAVLDALHERQLPGELAVEQFEKLVQAWLARHPRFVAHFTPVHCSWMNPVEQWFSILRRKRLRHPNFANLTELEAQIAQFIAEWNERAHPFRWTATSFTKIIAKVEAALEAEAATALQAA